MKIKSILTILGAAWLISSCTTDDITAEPVGRELVQTFYQTDEQNIMALNGAYDPLQHVIWGGGHYMWGSITSDDAVGGGESGEDQKGYQVCDRFIASPVEDVNANLEEFYTLWWRMNSRCNAIIKYASTESVLGSKAIANAYFLKGLAYFNLIRMFGGMPIIDDETAADVKFGRASVEDSWSAAEGYLLAAINMTDGTKGLDVRKGMRDPASGYATLGSAQALLGKVYMYQEKYSEAINILSALESSGQYALEEDYSQVFHPGNPHGVESIFEVNFTDKGAQSWEGPPNNGNALATLVSPRAFGNVVQAFPDGDIMSGWGMNQPTTKLVAAFDAMGDDIRKEVSVISTDYLQQMCDDAGVTTNWVNILTGYWDHKHGARSAYRISETQVNQNMILLRYSDVLLLLAEAHQKTGNDGLAQGYLNKVRNRVNLDDVTASGAALLTAIKKERQLELCLEGDRYFDLVRWGDAATELTAEEYNADGPGYADGLPGVASDGLFPIPQNEMIFNEGNSDFTQNKGYF